ncbi:MAG: hypothetical protein V4787_11760 [Pseudomonadota bacterium]
MSLEAQITELTAAVKGLDMTLRVLIENQKVHGVERPTITNTSVTGAQTTTEAPAATEGKKGPGRPKKEAAPAPQEAPAAAAPADDFDFGVEETASRTYTIEEIRNGLKSLSQGNKPAAIAILSKRGYKGVGEIRETDYAGVAGEIEAAGVKV